MPQERSTLHHPRTVADRIADVVTRFVGRWFCVIIHALVYGTWLKTGLFGLDPTPHALLTVAVATEAVFLALVILMGQNRQAAVDRARDTLEVAEEGALEALYAQQGALLQRLDAELALLRAEHRTLQDQVRRVLEQQEGEP